MKKIAILFLYVLLFVSVFSQTESIIVGELENYNFKIENKNIEYYKDKSNSLELHDIQTPTYNAKFRNPDSISVCEPNTNIWFKFQIKNISNELENVILAMSDFSYIEVYIISNSGEIDTLKSGLLLPTSEKQIKNTILELNSFYIKSNESKTVYVKAISEYAVKIQKLFYIVDYEGYYNDFIFFNFKQGLFYGFLLMMLFYNFFLFFITKQVSYLFYNLYIFGISLSILALLNYIRTFFFPETPEINKYFGFSFFFALIFYFLFMREFIDSKHNNLKLDKSLKRIIKVNILAAAILIIISFFSYFFYALLALIFLITNTFIIIVLIIKAISDGQKITRIFALGSSFLIISVLITATGRLYGIPQDALLKIFQAGIVLEVLVFSLGLSFKLKLSEQQLTESQAKLIDQYQKNVLLQTKVNRELEARVEERTHKISKQKDEIDALYKEMHHRVKNNFATLIGILELQIDKETNDDFKKPIINATSRIKSMSLIHELIHKNYSPGFVSVKEYLMQLKNYILQLSGTKTITINLNCGKDDFQLDVQTALPIGVILNELLINTIKYAKPKDGKIISEIEFQKNEKKAVLNYFDNGTETIYNEELEKNKSVGFFLIKTMTKQLEGEMNIKIENGFKASFTFLI